MSTAQQNHRTTTSSLRALTEAIEAYIAREQLSRCGFGKAALNDASFLCRLGRDSNLHLGTADKVLACMGLEPVGPQLPAKGRGLPEGDRHQAARLGQGRAGRSQLRARAG